MLEWFALIFLAAFVITLMVTPRLRLFLGAAGFLGIDQNKATKPRIPTSGGLCALGGVLGGIMIFIALNSFVLKEPLRIDLVLAATTSFLIATLIGMLDDMNMRSKLVVAATGTREYRLGLKQWQKALLPIAAAIPLMAVRAGYSVITLPIFGPINVGIIFPLLLIPIAVTCVTNAANMLAGLNGLEAGLGFIASLSLGIFTLLYGSQEGAAIAFALAGALLAFLIFNWYPAKILPGDSLTYLIGSALIAAIIIGNVEKFGIMIFTPWILEAFLKLKAGFKASSLGVLQYGGSLKSRYNRTYSLTHVVMNMGNFTEKQISIILISFEVLVCILSFSLIYFKIV